jgi:PEP-CTERM motif
MKRFLSVVGAVLLMAAGPASADVIFTFDGVMFDDGGTLDGSFTTDDTLMTLLDYNLTTSGGTLTGFTYTPLTAPDNFSSLPSILVVEPLTNNPILQVTFTSLMATGGLITIGTFDSFEQVGADHRDITAGQVTPGTTSVPEPATTSLLAIGAMALLAGLRRRRSG